MMCQDSARPLTFETLLADPLVRLVMQADGVSVAELVAVMEVARDAVTARERSAVMYALSARSATSAQA